MDIVMGYLWLFVLFYAFYFNCLNSKLVWIRCYQALLLMFELIASFHVWWRCNVWVFFVWTSLFTRRTRKRDHKNENIDPGACTTDSTLRQRRESSALLNMSSVGMWFSRKTIIFCPLYSHRSINRKITRWFAVHLAGHTKQNWMDELKRNFLP